MKREYVVTKVEGGLKLTGDTLNKPVFPSSKRKALQRVTTEITKATRDAEALTITVEVATK